MIEHVFINPKMINIFPIIIEDFYYLAEFERMAPNYLVVVHF